MCFYHDLRIQARSGGMCGIELIERQCRQCGTTFFVCRPCWRGQSYCHDRCLDESCIIRHREAQRKYRQTELGREQHARAERERRQRSQPWFVQEQAEKQKAGDGCAKRDLPHETCDPRPEQNRDETVLAEGDNRVADRTSKGEKEGFKWVEKSIFKVVNGCGIQTETAKICHFCGRAGKVVGTFSPKSPIEQS